MIYDVCVVGSGAGAGPIIYELSRAGLKVCVLEKGNIYNEKDFSKDELLVRRSIYTPNLKEQYHTIEEFIDGSWQKFPTYETGWSFWNGTLLGGSSNFMSGFFHRLKPNDFKLASTYGVAKDSNIVDWAISYEELEPYYTKVEELVGISGEVQEYAFLEPRSTKDFPYAPLAENKIVDLIDKSCKELGYKSVKTPRAIISKQKNHRNPCYYSNYCGSYPCSSGAKGSSRASLIKDALLTNNLTIIANANVIKLNTNKENKIQSTTYISTNIKKSEVKEFQELLSFEIGKSENDEPIVIKINDLREFDNRNIAIAGMAGSGKTQLIKDILYQISKNSNNDLKFIFFDYKGEGNLEQLQPFLEATKAEFVDIVNDGGVDFNPFLSINLDERQRPFSIRAFVDTISTFVPRMGVSQENILISLINDLLDRKNGSYPTIAELFRDLESYYEEN